MWVGFWKSNPNHDELGRFASSNQEGTGQVISASKGSGFNQISHHFMQMHDGSWQRVQAETKEKGVYRWEPTSDAKTTVDDIKNEYQNFSQVESPLKPGEYISNGSQLHAVSPGTKVVSRTGEESVKLANGKMRSGDDEYPIKDYVADHHRLSKSDKPQVGDYIEVLSDAGGVDAAPFTTRILEIHGWEVWVDHDGDQTIKLDPANLKELTALKDGTPMWIFYKADMTEADLDNGGKLQPQQGRFKRKRPALPGDNQAPNIP